MYRDITGNLQSIRTWRAAQQKTSSWCLPLFCGGEPSVQIHDSSIPPPAPAVTTTIQASPDRPLEEQVLAHVSGNSSKKVRWMDIVDYRSS